MNHKKIFVYFVLFVFLIGGGLSFGAGTAEAKKPHDKKRSSNSLAWQLEEVVQWIIKTRNLKPASSAAGPPFYVIDSLTLNGSVEKNKIGFSFKGKVLAGKKQLIPLFGPPDRVMLQNVTLNGKPAVIGFDDKGYYARTSEPSFVIAGEIGLKDEPSFTVPGPVNLFSANFTDGRVVEGGMHPGVKNAVFHLETGKPKDPAQVRHEPLFQVSRAIRIQKEITFEYEVRVRSGREISRVEIPLNHGEIVLDVPGIKGWKHEKNILVVPASGREVKFKFNGRLPDIKTFTTDKRSNYEWWLIESDEEHRVRVETKGKPVDTSKSPLKRKLSSSRLYLLSKGQEISVNVSTLNVLDAMAVVIDNQYRKIVWTPDGQLVFEDRVKYNNTAVDYISFDNKGKPLYFDSDHKAKAILSEDKENPNRILIPLEKGEHSFSVQGISRSEPSLFGGVIELPVAGHSLCVNRSSVQFCYPSHIIPFWTTGGERIGFVFSIYDILWLVIGLIPVFLLLKPWKLRLAGIAAIVGLYISSYNLYIFLVFLAAVILIIRIMKRQVKKWRLWLASGIVVGIALYIVLHLVNFMNVLTLWNNINGGMSVAGSGGMAAVYGDYRVPKKERFADRFSDEGIEYSRMRAREEREEMENNTLKGVVPVPIDLPGFHNMIIITRELVTEQQPLAPKIYYITTYTLIPIILLWLYCWFYIGFEHRKEIKLVLEKAKGIIIA